MNWFAIAAGGALGALLRAGVSHWFKSSPGHFPWGTFTVNVLGCLLMGALYVLIMERHWVDPAWRPFLMVGLLGAMTTFSTFALETLSLWQADRPVLAGFYALGSLSGCLLAVGLGYYLTTRALDAQ